MKADNKVLKQIIQSGFYLDIDISEETAIDNLKRIFLGQYSVNLYCTICGESSIFKKANDDRLNKLLELVPEEETYTEKFKFIHDVVYDQKLYPYFYLQLPCVRCNKNIIYCLKLDEANKTVMKIGQYPSIVDLSQDIDKKYEKLLSKEYFREYKEAVRLFSHGVGIGSFVYLRRIIDKLILDTYLVNKGRIAIDEADYRRLRFDDKISHIIKYLSPLVQEFLSPSYSILSKGVHELSEEECKLYFEPLKLTIKLILDEKIRKDEEEKERIKLKKSINKIKNELS